MTFVWKTLLNLLILSVGGLTSLSPGDVPSGTLEGTITDDATGNVIEDVHIMADNGISQEDTETNDSGAYSMTLAVGTYTITVQHEDYYSQTVNGVDVQSGTITTLNFALLFKTQFGVRFKPGKQTNTGLPGEIVIHTFVMKNTGNVSDTYTMTLAGNNWPTSVPDVVGPLSPGEVVFVDVAVTIPDNVPLGKNLRGIAEGFSGETYKHFAQDIFTMTATSQTDTSVLANSRGRTRVLLVLDVDIFPRRQRKVALPGEVVTYTFDVVNSGAYTDTYDLVISKNKWPTELSQETVGPLGPGEGTTVLISVTVPADTEKISKKLGAPHKDRFTLLASSTMSRRVRARAMAITYIPK